MLQGSVHYLLGQLKGHAIYACIQPLYHKGLIDGVLQRWFYMNYESSVLLLTFSASAFSFSFFLKHTFSSIRALAHFHNMVQLTMA